MANLNPSSVTLIFYKLGPVRQEPLLNIVASALQWSSFCHTEIAIGENRTADGAMVNVARVFNDAVGVELTARTGRNPNYVYVQLGCSELATQRMLQFARAQVGKPFSQMGMARSIVWPRKTDCTSWYCAELTAAILQVGGLLHKQSNPGAATPSSLYELFAPRAAVAANPFKVHLLLQQQQQNQGDAEDTEPMLHLGLKGAFATSSRAGRTSSGVNVRQHFKPLQVHPQLLPCSGNAIKTSGLTLNSLMTTHWSR